MTSVECTFKFQLDEIMRDSVWVVFFQVLNFYTEQGIYDKFENLSLDIMAEELDIFSFPKDFS